MLKIALKHFIFSQCIDITFDQILNNFIKPDMSSNRMNEYIKRITQQFPDRDIKLKWSRQHGKNDAHFRHHPTDNKPSRYTEVSHILDEEKYYRTVTFGSIVSTLNS